MKRVPLEIYEETFYEIYDPNEAKVIAQFSNEKDAIVYVTAHNMTLRHLHE